MTSAALTLILVIFGLLLAGIITRDGDLVWMALPFLAYLGIGIWLAPTAERIRLRAARSVIKKRDGGSSCVEVRVVVHNEGAALPRIQLTDPLLPSMRVADGQLGQAAALRNGESMLLTYTFQSQRGRFAWGAVRAVVSDPFGLIETQTDCPAEAKILVQPELKRFRTLPVRPQRTLASAGSIPARLGGRGTDFWGVREYHPGDPLRQLDWRLTARHPHKFFTKEFEQEEIADIGLILDARHETDMHVGETSLFEHLARATASLAEVFLRQGNRVSLLIYGKPIISLFPGYGKVQLNQVLNALAQANTSANTDLDDLQFLPLQLFSSRSIIVVLSALTLNDWRLFPRLRAYGYQPLLISPDPLDFARTVLPDDRTGELAARLAYLERQLEIQRIRQLRVPVVDWQAARPLFPLVHTVLSRFHVQRQR